MRVRKAFKITLAIIIAFILIAVCFAAVIFLDVAAYTATASQTLTPTGTSAGKALVVYDPGLSGTAKTVAEKIATDLQERDYTVTFAGVKSSAVANTTDYAVVVAGGPVYAGGLTSSIRDFLNNLPPGHASEGYGAYIVTRVGVFGSGQGASAPEDIAQIKQSVAALADNGTLSNAVVVKIGHTEDLTVRAQDFVNQLIG
jgi:flavodoxin